MASDANNEGRQDYSYSRTRLYFSAISACTLLSAVGVVLYWPSPALPLLKSRNFTSFENSMLGSLPGLAPGPLLTIFGIDLIGRKGTLFVIWSTMMLGWVIMCISENINVILTARFISGWGMGAAFSAVGIFTSEMADVAVRGSLNSISVIFLALGALAEYAVGPFVSYGTLTYVSTAVTCVFGLLYWFLPESPYYYVAKGQIKKAESTLTWIRKNAPKEMVDEELSQIVQTITNEKENKISIGRALTSKAVLKQFAVAWYILFMQQLTGLGAFAAYAQTIFDAAKYDFNAAYIPIGITVYSVFVSSVAPFLVKRYGNRIIFIVAGFACSLSYLLLGSYFLLLEGGYGVSSYKFLPMLSAIILMTSFYFGFGGLVWGVVADIFSPAVKGSATGICGIFSTFLGFVGTTIFGLAKDAIGFGPLFMVYCLLLFIFSFGLFLIPEVTKKTLQEIQDYFNGISTRSES